MTGYNNAFVGVPRFGHTVDFSVLFGDSASEKTDYTLGTIFTGAFLSAIFVMWLALLLIFMWRGPSRVGMLSGFPMKHPWRKESFQTPIAVRSAFLFSCVLVIIGAVFLTTSFGLTDLKSATETTKDIVTVFSEVTEQGDDMVKNMLLELQDFQENRNSMLNDLRAENFCSEQDIDFFTGQPIHELRNKLVQDLYNLDDFGEANFTALRNEGFDKMKSHSDSMAYYINLLGVKEWHLWLFLVSFVTIPSFMMIGVTFAWIERAPTFLTCLNTWFHLPIFLVLVTFLWILLSVLSVGLVFSADFCSSGRLDGSPDESSNKIVELTQDEYLQNIYGYWISSDSDCASSDFPLIFVPNTIDNLERAIESISKLETAMNLATNLESICNNDFIVIRGYLRLLSGDYSQLSRKVANILELLSCNKIHPLYSDLVHDIVCDSAPESATWAFFSLLLVCVFSMIVITFRSSWFNTIKIERHINSSENEDVEQEKSVKLEGDDDSDDVNVDRNPQGHPN